MVWEKLEKQEEAAESQAERLLSYIVSNSLTEEQIADAQSILKNPDFKEVFVESVRKKILKAKRVE